MADPQEDTPSQNVPTSPVEFAIEAVARTTREISDGLFARLEMYRGMSQAERDIALVKEAEHMRTVKHYAAETEGLFRALSGYRTPRELRVHWGTGRKSATTTAKNLGLIMGGVAALIGALAAAWSAIFGHGGGK